MAIYEINSFSGISDYADRGITGSFKMGRNLDVRKIDDTLSCGQALVDEGLNSSASPSASSSPSSSVSRSPSPSVSLSPSETPSPSASASPSSSSSLSPSPTPSSSISSSPSPSGGLTTVFADLIKWFVKGSDGYVYGFGNTGYIYRRDDDGFWIVVYKDPGGEITGAAEFPNDSNETYLYWVTGTSLHRKKVPGRSDWNDVDEGDDWPKTNLNSADYHTMVVAAGQLHIANRSWLALVGLDESFTNESLNLIPGNYVKTLVERGGRVNIGTFRNSDPNKGINAAIDCEIPMAQVGDEGELYYANMVDSVPIKQFPGGGKCNPGGVTNQTDQVNFFEWESTALSWIDKQSVGNMSMWGVHSATTNYNGVYSYGRKNKNHPFTMNMDYWLEVDEIGAIANKDGIDLISYQEGTDFGVKATDTTAKAVGYYEGLELKAKTDKVVADITGWRVAEIYCEPLPDGSKIEFQYKLDKSGDWITAYMANGSSDFDEALETKAIFNIAEKGDIFEPRIVITPTGNTSPEIHRCRFYFN
jgi:hypothetical protein